MRNLRGREGGAMSMRKALKTARQAGLIVKAKKASSLVRIMGNDGTSITISSLDKVVTRKTAMWLRRQGVRGE